MAADVPDVRPYLRRASAVVVPIRKGGGLKNKVLEGCAMRRPIVASPRALGGLSARVGVDVLSAARRQQWVERVGRLLDRPEYARRVARNGYDWVRQSHCWSTTGQRFYEILVSAWQNSGGRRSSCAKPSLAGSEVPAPPAGRPTRTAEWMAGLSDAERSTDEGSRDAGAIVGAAVTA